MKFVLLAMACIVALAWYVEDLGVIRSMPRKPAQVRGLTLPNGYCTWRQTRSDGETWLCE